MKIFRAIFFAFLLVLTSCGSYNDDGDLLGSAVYPVYVASYNNTPMLLGDVVTLNGTQTLRNKTFADNTTFEGNITANITTIVTAYIDAANLSSLNMSGDILPTTNNTRSFGSNVLKWLTGWFVNLVAETVNTTQVTSTTANTTNLNANTTNQSGHIYLTPVEPTGGGSVTATLNVTAGALSGTYKYTVTFVTATGETYPISYSNQVVALNEQIDLTNLPISPDSRVTARNIYRNAGVYSSSVDVFLVTTINNNTATVYTDNVADGSLGVRAPIRNTTGGIIYLNEVPFAYEGQVTAFGKNAGQYSVGTYNTFIGWNAGQGVAGNGSIGLNNAAVGTVSLGAITTGNFNAALGDGAGQYLTTGTQNLFVGDHTGFGNPMTGWNNTIVGSRAGGSLTSGNGNVWLGRNAGGTLTTTNNTLIIANSDTTNPLVYGTFPNSLLRINASNITMNGSSYFLGKSYFTDNPILSNNIALQWANNGGGGVSSILYLDSFNQTRLDSPIANMNINSGITTDIVLWGSATGTNRQLLLSGSNANAGNVSQDSPTLNLRARYWTGASNGAWIFGILNDMTNSGATPSSNVTFTINSTEVMKLENLNGTVGVFLSVNGTVSKVYAGASDTGGTGYKMLIIPN